MEQKLGWTYRFIESLNMQIAINDTSGIMYTEDKVRYSAEEQKLLQSIDLGFITNPKNGEVTALSVSVP